MRRDWSDARAKVDAEARCRAGSLGGCRGALQAAHVLGRAYDAPSGRVEAADIIPLCEHHHTLYDARRIDLLPYLSNLEQAAAVLQVGITRAERRITGHRAQLSVVPGGAR